MANKDLQLMVYEIQAIQRGLAEREIREASAAGRPLEPVLDRITDDKFAFTRWAVQKLLATDPEEAERFSLDMAYTHLLIELRDIPADQWPAFMQSVLAEHRTRMHYATE